MLTCFCRQTIHLLHLSVVTMRHAHTDAAPQNILVKLSHFESCSCGTSIRRACLLFLTDSCIQATEEMREKLHCEAVHKSLYCGQKQPRGVFVPAICQGPQGLVIPRLASMWPLNDAQHLLLSVLDK